MSVTQTPYVHYTILILHLRKMRLGVFTNFSEVTQLELKCRFSNPQVRTHSTLLLDLAYMYFVYASLNALLNLLGLHLSLRTSSVFCEAL